MEDDKKRYFKGLIDTASLEGREDKRLQDLLDRRQSIRSAPVKAENYTSEIDRSDEIMRAKGGTEKINTNQEIARFKNDTSKINTNEVMDKISNSTDRIDTKQIAPITSGEDFSKKMQDLDIQQKLKATMAQAVKSGDNAMIDKLKLLAGKIGKKVPMLAGVAAIGNSIMNPSESMASDLASSAADMATPTGAEVSGTGFNADSLEGRFERGLLSPEEMQDFYKKQALMKMRGE